MSVCLLYLLYKGFLVCDSIEYNINHVRSQRQTILISRLPQPSASIFTAVLAYVVTVVLLLNNVQ